MLHNSYESFVWQKSFFNLPLVKLDWSNIFFVSYLQSSISLNLCAVGDVHVRAVRGEFPVRVHLKPFMLRKFELFSWVLKPRSIKRYTILFSHGNGSDLGQMTAAMLQLGLFLQCNVFAYDYTGYGESRGTASAKNVMADADAACSGMCQHCHEEWIFHRFIKVFKEHETRALSD